MMLRPDSEYPKAPWELYEFVDGNRAENHEFIAQGYVPWWMLPDLKITFFRPLSSLSLWLDTQLDPRSEQLPHVHSLGMFALWIIAVGCLYWRTLPGRIGALALLLYALDESHVLPTFWICHRNSLVAVWPALLGFLAHLRWRENGWQPGLWLSLLGYSVGFLGGELALSALAYLFAYELLAGPGDWRKKLLSFAPGAGLTILYLVFQRVADYGTYGSNFYLDPRNEPLPFLEAFSERFPTILGDALLNVPAVVWLLSPESRPLLVVVGLVAFSAVAGLYALARARLADRVRIHTDWLALGSFLALLPGAAAIPSNRLFLCPMIGLSVVLSVILWAAWTTVFAATRGSREDRLASDSPVAEWQPAQSVPGLGRRLFWGAAGVVLGVSHLGFAPFMNVSIQNAMIDSQREIQAVADTTPLDSDEKDYLVLNSPNWIVSTHIPLMRQWDGRPRGRSWRPLAQTPHPFVLRRTDDRTLELTMQNGELLTSVFESLYRGTRWPLRKGDQVPAGLFVVEVLDDNGRGPTRVAFRFQGSLDSPSLVLLAWHEGRLHRHPLAVGQAREFRHEPGPGGL